MTDVAGAMQVRRGEPAIESSRSAAFRAADLHSGRVRWLRRLILIGAVGGTVALFGIAFFDPFNHLPKNVSVAHAGLDGTRITMAKPKLSGYRQDGRPYAVHAVSGVQDIRKPNIIELNDMEARFTLSDQSVARLESPHAVYDSTRNFMTFPGQVHISSDSGYDIYLQSAEMDIKAGNMVSKDPVTVHMTSGTVAADSLSMTDGGQRITFDGHVQSSFTSTAATTDKADKVAAAKDGAP